MRIEIRLIGKCLYLTKFQYFQRTFRVFYGTAMSNDVKIAYKKVIDNKYRQIELFT